MNHSQVGRTPEGEPGKGPDVTPGSTWSSPNIASEPWKAPKADQAVLVWPDGNQMVRAAQSARLHFANSSVQIAGLPLSEFRAKARAFLGHHTDAPLVMTGHQSELHHPGVWAKNVAIDAIARACGQGSLAVHLAVDTDAPKHLFIRLDQILLAITDDPKLSTAKWTGQLAAPTPIHLLSMEGMAEDWSKKQTEKFGFEPLLCDTLAEMRRFALEGYEGVEVPAMLANAMHKLDWSLGLDYQVMMMSQVLSSSPWLAFASHLLADASQFSLHYNRALATYRTDEEITSDTRPMPDLAILGNKIEMPFWLDSLATGQRVRLHVFETPTGSRLVSPVSDDSVELLRTQSFEDASIALAQFCRRNQLRISPRAITLTCFVRLCLADLFIHGIGGGRYDQVLDRIFVSYFKLTPPQFAVVTATMFHPAAVGRTRACVPCAMMEGHRLKHDLLGDEKFEMLRQIEASPRNSASRYSIFQEMHRKLEERELADPRVKDWQTRMDQALVDRDLDHLFFDRELFYAQQPRHRLQSLIEKIRSMFPNEATEASTGSTGSPAGA
jgi:hypothetical protein